MATESESFQILPFPASRQLVVDAGRNGTRRHIMHGFMELDVSRARDQIRRHKEQTGESLSFTAFIVSCLAQAIAANPSVQAYRDWRNRLIVFDDVDAVVMVETRLNAVSVPHVIRAANRKTFRQINDEIRAVQNSDEDVSRSTPLTRLGLKLPWFIRDLGYRVFLLNPRWFRKIGGTVTLSSVGMFFDGGGWGLSFLPLHTLGLTVGGIAEKPIAVDGRVEIRECLDLTLSLDHDVVDGAPAARFAKQFKHLIETGSGLCD